MSLGGIIGTAFDAKRNSLNAIRLILAALVIVSHSWPIGGYGDDPGFGDQTLGEWAVAGFFGISGFLITSSRLHSRNVIDYLWRRVLRIYPAFLVVLIVIAFIFAPLSVYAFGDGTWSIGAALRFIGENFLLIIRQYGIDGTLHGAAYSSAWDGALWTLFYEFVCYVAIGVLVSVLPHRVVPAAVTIIFVLCTGATWMFATGHLEARVTIVLIARLGAFFCAGALVYLYRNRIPSSPWVAAGAAVLVVLTMATSSFQIFAGLPVAYLMMYLGSVLPLHRVGAKNDISYGLYIYGFPVQQMLYYLFAHTAVPVFVFAPLSLAATIPFAYASWFAIERPAMKLKRLTARRAVDREGHVLMVRSQNDF